MTDLSCVPEVQAVMPRHNKQSAPLRLAQALLTQHVLAQ
jgi:hypothetical protein